MGQGASTARAERKPRAVRIPRKVTERVQLLEELVQGASQGRRQQLLQQITGSSAGQSPSGYFLPSAPEEFKLGCLIAAGSYGRVYAGTYCGQPAALKLLILDEDSAAAILNEVRLCLKLTHKNLVRLLDCAVVSTSQYDSASQEHLGGWLSSAAGLHSLQPPSPGCPYSYLPMLGDVAMQHEQPGSGIAAAGGSVIVRASQADHSMLTGNELLQDVQQQQQRHIGLTSPAGHACFEVWIAMELCDGGTLAEQVQQGFQYNPDTRQVDMELLLTLAIDIARALSYMHAEHVCHGDLKSENVLLKSLGPASMDGSGSSSCWGSNDDCFLTMLCSTASSTSYSYSKCRRHSSDSCWSCCSRGSANARTPAAAGTSRWGRTHLCRTSSSSSASSTPASEGRHAGSSDRNTVSRSSNLLSRSLSGLCCVSAPHTMDGDDGGTDECVTSGSNAAVSCLCCTATQSSDDLAACIPSGSMAGCSNFTGQFQQQPSLPGLNAAVASNVEHHKPSSTIAGITAQQEQPFLEGLNTAAAEQLSVIAELQRGQMRQDSLSRSREESAEEEHIAPLSLYATAREHRRSRRLSQSALLPSMQAAIAAAASRYNMSSTVGQACTVRQPGSESSGSGAECSSSEEESEHQRAAGNVPGMPLQLQQQYSVTQTLQADAADADVAGSSVAFDAPAGRPSIAVSSPDAAALASAAAGMAAMPGRSPAAEQQVDGCAVGGHDVYACRLPPRNRRHSYCYGASYTSEHIGLLGFGKPGHVPCISAAEAATAIAAAAEAVKEEWRATTAARKRNRRMSFDDRLLLQRKGSVGLPGSIIPGILRTTSGDSSSNCAFGMVSGLGRAPAVLRRCGSGSSNQQEGNADAPSRADRLVGGLLGDLSTMLASGSADVKPRSARRHSWAGYGAAAGDAKALRPLSSLLRLQDQQQRADSTASWLLSGDVDQQLAGQSLQAGRDAVCLPTAALSAAPFSGRRRARRMSAAPAVGMHAAPALGVSPADPACCSVDKPQSSGRRARRHSWAGVGYEQLVGGSAGAGRRNALHALSSCFPFEFDSRLLKDLVGSDSSQRNSGSDSSRKLFHLPSCCGDPSYLPRDDTAADMDAEAQTPLLSGSCSSTTTGLEMSSESAKLGDECSVSVSCLGRALTGSSGSSSARNRNRSRRSSWCCTLSGAPNQQDAAADWSVHSGVSGMTTPLLPLAPVKAAGGASVVPYAPAHSTAGSSSHWRRSGRRSSWDGARLGTAANNAPLLASLSGASAATAAAGGMRIPLTAAPYGASNSSGSAGSIQSIASSESASEGPHSAGSNYDEQVQRVGSSMDASQSAQLQPQSQMQHQQQDAEQQLQRAEQEQPLTLAAAYPTATASSQSETPLLACSSPLQPFAGSFEMPKKQYDSSRRSSIGSLAVVLPPVQHQLISTVDGGKMQAASSSVTQPLPQLVFPSKLITTDGKGRRWSTGVAAHDLLLRKQSLLQSPARQLTGAVDCTAGQASNVLMMGATNGNQVGPKATSVRCRVALPSQELGDGMLSRGGLQQRDAVSSAAAEHVHDALVARSNIAAGIVAPVSASSWPGSVGGASEPSTASNQAENVLGMPTHRPNVLNQRRMSYDTATGAYTLVNQNEQMLLTQQLQHQHQQHQQQPGTLVLQPVASVQSHNAQGLQEQQQVHPAAVYQHQDALTVSLPEHPSQQQPSGPEAMQQQQLHAHMQRLKEALAKKGYSTSLMDNVASPSTDSTLQAQQQSPMPAAFETRPLNNCATASTASTALQQPQMVATSIEPQVSRVRYTAKVCDFGFSQCLRAGQSHCSTAAAGTITHQAPEVLKSGYLSPAADIYAFGIILWELLTGERPFRGLLEGDLVVGVCEGGLRPTFPPGAPPAFVALAQQCWAQDAADRPTAQQLLKRLNEMLYDERRAKALQQTCPNHGCQLASDSSKSRRRRHSMPAVGSTRQRRMSRRLSLFLPFSRQPAAVPEHEPLEQVSAGLPTMPVSAATVAAAVLPSSSVASIMSNRPMRSCSGVNSSGSLAQAGPNSASGHAVRLRGLQQGTVSSNSGNTAGSALAAAHEEGTSAGSQWFQSFDD